MWQLPDGDVPDGDVGWTGCHDEGRATGAHRFRLGPRTLIFGCSWTSLDLSRIYAALIAHLGCLAFESQGAFAS